MTSIPVFSSVFPQVNTAEVPDNIAEGIHRKSPSLQTQNKVSSPLPSGVGALQATYVVKYPLQNEAVSKCHLRH
jgi:hypothetical protein